MSMIQMVKNNVVFREFPTAEFSLNTMSGLVVITSRATGKPEVVYSSNYFDYVEITDETV